VKTLTFFAIAAVVGSLSGCSAVRCNPKNEEVCAASGQEAKHRADSLAIAAFMDSLDKEDSVVFTDRDK
jgi:hypothetical protein